MAVNALLLALTGACGPIVKPAPFPQRLDSVRAGSQLGPFEGQVVDADTQRPLAEAIVMCSWAFDRGLGTPAPEAVRVYTTRTDADGRYRVPALRNFPSGLTTRLARLSFVAYRKEYVSFRHDRTFNQPTVRTAFAQLGGVIRLSRWSPELSHARHLIFTGGGPALEEATRWELLAATTELDGQTGKPALASDLGITPAAPLLARAHLDASVLLSTDDVRTITGYKGEFSIGRLAGPRTQTYDTFHLRALDRPERYDVALRIWRTTATGLQAKYEEILQALPGSQQRDQVGDRSFVTLQGEIHGLGFVENSAQVVLLITCGRGQCTKDSHLLDLARRVEKNLTKLPTPAAEESASPESAPSPASTETPPGLAPEEPEIPQAPPEPETSP